MWASGLQSEAGSPQSTVSGEARAVIKSGGQEHKRRGRRVLRFRHTGLK